MKNKFLYLLIIIVAILTVAFVFSNKPVKEITSFDECIAAGNPILESYPAQCIANGRGFRQDIGNELEKIDLIMIASPRPNETVSSPLEISGEARGTWYFEADFPVYLYDASGNKIATGIAQAQGEWMTEEFVPFSVTLVFDEATLGSGTLVLEKNNPSGLLEQNDELRVPVKF
ncbi:hypothetical protein A2886_01955 [candidate division WWE3 bacterium RIFCSPHIGHO2_01_FULL_42_13]|uniref:Bacterial spore germination immunoglobulin-like domain-containing protein n=1 Tax=candidate division WWE3 bacterium RIFCSPHIGHO2_01_FULL_42_13 TaxID=1802617 RepID=A0A1F4UR24_UNCKA|nr:MAG: hypothetical protein A2886_01955 [candidate division WWE3 bacterium RIFCSPHIGHO2_01_FULL_42_13]